MILPSQLLTTLYIRRLYPLRGIARAPEIEIHEIRSIGVEIRALGQSTRKRLPRVGDFRRLLVRGGDEVIYREEARWDRRIVLRPPCDFAAVGVILQIPQ